MLQTTRFAPHASTAAILGAIAIRLGSPNRTAQDRLGAADALSHRNRVNGAIVLTGAAFHTRITVNNPGFLVLDHEYAVRAYFGASSAPDTFVHVEI
jgi:hypothetical protein